MTLAIQWIKGNKSAKFHLPILIECTANMSHKPQCDPRQRVRATIFVPSSVCNYSFIRPLMVL
jgi:hypothetical protein